jgi:ferredoxin
LEGPLKIKVDAKLCELHGQCAFVAPELFRVEGENLVFEESVPAILREKARMAAKVCPQLAITVTDE